MKLRLINLFCFLPLMVFALNVSGQVVFHCYSFNLWDSTNTIKSGNAVELNDGTMKAGEKLDWKPGKGIIVLDNVTYKKSEVKGFVKYQSYWGRVNGDFLKVIETGPRLTIYHDDAILEGDAKFGKRCAHYVRVGNSEEVERIYTINELAKYVQECPKAAEMLDLKGPELLKATKKNRSYLNQVMKLYNNNCQ